MQQIEGLARFVGLERFVNEVLHPIMVGLYQCQRVHGPSLCAKPHRLRVVLTQFAIIGPQSPPARRPVPAGPQANACFGHWQSPPQSPTAKPL
jgi:hypothetical protein